MAWDVAYAATTYLTFAVDNETVYYLMEAHENAYDLKVKA